MAKRSVIWTATASKQLREVITYWNKRTHSNRFSLRLLDKIEARIETIIAFPLEHPETSFQGIRTASLGHYSLFYKNVGEKGIVIMAFWDNRQDPKKLLRILSIE